VSSATEACDQPRTRAARRALRAAHDVTAISDLLFLEAWEMQASHDMSSCDIASTLRAGQIRRANPSLAEAIRAELRVSLPPVRSRTQ
jgi:hypothetical protein